MKHKMFLEEQVSILDKYDIIYHSVNIKLSWNGEKLRKEPFNMP
jgi:hypothetical protein